MALKRRSLQGVLNVLNFNRHFYLIGVFILGLALTIHIKIGLPDYIFWIVIAAFLYALVVPLIVSAYVYDYSGYYNLHWLQNTRINPNVKSIVNINAGFDETSFILKGKFPHSKLKVFDFYDPKRHTESAIIRARKVSLTYPNTVEIKSTLIPLEDKSVDVIFLLSAIHEIRSYKEKVLFLKECHRICKPTAKVVMVEHLRDFPNFLAFTIGFTHFFSRSTWKNAFIESGFRIFREAKFTPFMSIFNIEP